MSQCKTPAIKTINWIASSLLFRWYNDIDIDYWSWKIWRFYSYCEIFKYYFILWFYFLVVGESNMLMSMKRKPQNLWQHAVIFTVLNIFLKEFFTFIWWVQLRFRKLNNFFNFLSSERRILSKLQSTKHIYFIARLHIILWTLFIWFSPKWHDSRMTPSSPIMPSPPPRPLHSHQLLNL